MIRPYSYREQFERVKRYYERLKQINNGIPPCKDGVYEVSFLDEFYAFFVFCRHLEDWIKHDKSVNFHDKKNILRKLMDRNECLTICRDICNGIKHLEPFQYKGKFDNNQKVSLKIKNGKWESILVKHYVLTREGKKDAFELATECLNKWEEFIRENIEKNQ
jgi:hypothetical protein